MLLEDNVSSESEEEFLCQKHQKPGKLNIDFEVNITPNMTDKYNNETLPKALRTQALTALTSNFGLAGLVQYAW